MSLKMNLLVALYVILYASSICLYADDPLTDSLRELTHALRKIRIALPATPEDRELFAKYPTVFEWWPERYQKIIADYYRNKELFKDPEHSIDNKKNALAYGYSAVGDYFGIFVYQISGYNFFYSKKLMQGQRVEPPNVYKQPWQEADRLQAVGNYKIHLMPKTQDIPIILSRLLEELENNKALASAVKVVKVLYNTDDLYDRNKNILPIIVVYPAQGKQNAQKVLDVFRDLFKDREGLNVTPRYNQQVTDLIYFAQGDGDMKMSHPDFFEQPEMIYYKSDFVLPGKDENYILRIHET